MGPEKGDFDDANKWGGQSRMHDLMNRLTALKCIAQLLDRQVRRDDWQHDKIIANVDRLQEEVASIQQVADGLYAGERAAPNRDADARNSEPH